MTSDIHIRLIAEADWTIIADLEAGAYRSAGLSEGPTLLKSRASASPATCFVLEVGQRIVGYVLSLPYPAFQYPDLNRTEDLTGGPLRSRNLHLHDLVIADGFQRRGFGRRLHQYLTSIARLCSYERVSLIAVSGSESFWSANGYRAHREIILPESYGVNALYMSKPI